MNWIDLSTKTPQKKGPYIVSISRHSGNGKYIFFYVAFFDIENNTWHKYNPFDDKESIGEEITDRVIGWIENTSTYLG